MVEPEPVDSGCDVEPHPGLAPYVNRIVGYRASGMAPGIHVGMPSPYLTVIVCLDDPLVVQAPGQPPSAFWALASGLHDHPMWIHHDGAQHGIQLDLTPAGARALLGLPAGELASRLVDLPDLLDPADRQLADRVASGVGWRRRIAVVEAALLRRLDRTQRRLQARPEVSRAWEEIRRTAGTIPVWAVAAEVGWSSRYLGEQFRAEYGLGVKTAARVARFDRSRHLISGRRPLAEVAAVCGYADQAHLNRDWRQFAGTSPTRWASDDELAYFAERQQ